MKLSQESQRICPHLQECQQKIPRKLMAYCLGKTDWNQEQCYLHNDARHLITAKPYDVIMKKPSYWELTEKVVE